MYERGGSEGTNEAEWIVQTPETALGQERIARLAATMRQHGSRSIDPLDLLERCGEENGWDDGLYHVTRTALLPGIRAHGLVPNPKAIQPTFDEVPSKHLKGRVFFAVSVPVAAEWWNQIGVFLNDERRSEPLSLLRIRPYRIGKYEEKLQHDEVGAEDVHPCSFFVSGRVAPEDIEIAKPKRAFGNTLSKVLQKVMENPEKDHWEEAFVWVPLGRRGSRAAQQPQFTGPHPWPEGGVVNVGAER